MYRGIDDLINKCHYYIEHEEKRDLIAFHGNLRAFNDHRYESRFSTLIAEIKNVS
jgi:spore maturation protein CgeB